MPNSNYHGGQKRETCYFCHSGPPLREQHIIPQRFDGPDTADNLVELCDLCHQRIERLYDKRFYEWFGIDDEKGKRRFHRQCETGDCGHIATVKFALGRISSSGGGTALYCRPCAAKKVRRYKQRMESKVSFRGTIDAAEVLEAAIIEEADE